MVGVAGFEPATPASRTQCSTRLSHTPTWRGAYRGAVAPSQGSIMALEKEVQSDVASVRLLRYLHRLAEPHGVLPFLLGNGVMVTQRFLVPSF